MSLPTFSLIIPTYNRPEALVNCLRACTQLSYPRDQLEVIVVDDGGKRPLTPIITPFQQSMQIHLITQPNQGPATARNKGAEMANGRYLAFTDDDCQPEANWLAALAAQFARSPAALLGGHTINALPHNPYAEASQTLINYLYDAFAGRDNAFFTSNNVALAKSLFLEVGRFQPEMALAAGEDREFCHRWVQSGRTMVFVPQAVVKHAHQLTAVSFWRQHVNYGRGAWQYHQLRAAQNQLPIQLEPFSFYKNLVSFPLRTTINARQMRTAGLLACTQVANAVGFFWEKLKA